MKKILTISFIVFLIGIIPASFAQEKDDLVILNTSSGDIIIEFFPNDAPIHVKNFLNLTESGFYDKTVFHRVIKDFMIQGGDPKTKPPPAYTTTTEWGTGGPGYSIPAEFNDIKHNRGIVSMARGQDPNSAGSQFFIVHENSNYLDGSYTVFGRIITQESFDTLDTIANLDTPESLYGADEGEILGQETTLGGTIPIEWIKGEIITAQVVSRSEISDLLDLGEPERTSLPSTTPIDSEYVNDNLGFSLTAPEGWLIQEPTKIHDAVPDVVLVGPIINGFNSAISVTVINSNGISIDEYVTEIKNDLADSINTGQLVILSEEKSVIKDNNVYVMDVKGAFITPENTFNLLFKEITFLYSDKFYKITYTNTEENFLSQLPQFSFVLDSLRFSSDIQDVSLDNDVSSNPNDGGGCLIATATYGSELAPQVQQLRELRDNTLLQTSYGSVFMTGFNQLYYSFSPSIADLERENPIFKEAVKLTITPMISSLSLLNFVEIDSDIEMLGYGISLIILNIGMYFVFPAMIIHRLVRTNNYQTSSTSSSSLYSLSFSRLRIFNREISLSKN